jgi:TolB protein
MATFTINGSSRSFDGDPDMPLLWYLRDELGLTGWFPHLSPDGQWIAFISFPKDIDPTDHPYYKRVYLRLMPASGGPAKVIGYVYGGQGTINVPSWSPDSRMVAFVSNTDAIK